MRNPVLIAATAATFAMALLGAADAAPRGEETRMDKVLAGRTPGESKRCIDRQRITSIDGYDGNILYRYTGQRIWRNAVKGACPGLKYGDIIVFEPTTRDLCEGDLVKTVARQGGQMTGACALGNFVAYDKPSK